MFQKGSTAIIILLAIVVSTIFAIGGFYISRSTGTKPEAKPPTNPSPTTNPELVFPTVCRSPTTNTCTESASRIRIHNNLDELIKGSELIVVGYVTDSCLVEDLTIKESGLRYTPYIGHLVIERSLKNSSKPENPFILTASLKELSNNSKTFSTHCVILTPNKRYLLFLEKRSDLKYYSFVDTMLEIQGSVLLKNSRNPNFFEQEIIQLGVDGLAERISNLTQ